jgi:hypothetical protein
MASRKCEECKKVARCHMVVDKSVTPGLIVYLCPACWRTLGFNRED